MGYNKPPITLLNYHNGKSRCEDPVYAEDLARKVSSTLLAFKVEGTVTNIRMSPFSVSLDIVPDFGVSIKSFKSLRQDLEVQLGLPIEIVSIGEEQFTICIAVKTWDRSMVGLREVMESDEFKNSDAVIPIATGMDVLGKAFVFDLASTPHLLVAGCTGSGKSVFLNDLILSVLYTKTPEEVKLILFDPKKVEFGPYKGIPHLLFDPISETKDAHWAFQWTEDEMLKRYQKFSEIGVKDIDGYNEKAGEKLPRIIVIIDEYMEMMFESPKEMEEIITRLARLARAAGIHLVLSTQRATTNVITGSIKANIPCRASFTMVDARETKTIAERTGGGKLLGEGDMLFSASDASGSSHIQTAYVTYKEIDDVIDFVRGQ